MARSAKKGKWEANSCSTQQREIYDTSTNHVLNWIHNRKNVTKAHSRTQGFGLKRTSNGKKTAKKNKADRSISPTNNFLSPKMKEVNTTTGEIIDRKTEIESELGYEKEKEKYEYTNALILSQMEKNLCR